MMINDPLVSVIINCYLTDIFGDYFVAAARSSLRSE